MRCRCIASVLAFLYLGTGCERPANPESLSRPLVVHPDTALRLHWIGKRQLTLEGSAFYFNRLWDLPETQQLESRTLDRLAEAPWRILHGQAAVAQAPVAPLRWILESLKYEESLLEVRRLDNGKIDAALAVRLSERDAGTWLSNMAFVVNSLTGIAPMSSAPQQKGWVVTHPDALFRIDLARERDWIVLGFAQAAQNASARILAEQIRSSPIPFRGHGSSNWLEADINISRLAHIPALQSFPFSSLSNVSIRITGDGGNVLTRVNATIPEWQTYRAQPWKVPTDYIRSPLAGFTAARGISNLIAQSTFWKHLNLGPAPEQIFFWSLAQNPFQIYAAAPVGKASTYIEPLSARLLDEINPWLRNNGPKIGDSGVPMFERLTNEQGIRWTVPGLLPFLKAGRASEQEYLLLGLTSEIPATPAAVTRKIEALIKPENVILAEWENTTQRLEALLPVLQTARVLAHFPPLPENCLALSWLTSIQSRLSETEGYVIRTSNSELEWRRKSALGLSALELHLLADWLESPAFPVGLHTFNAPPAAAP